MNLIDKVRLAREGAAVERCHAHPHLMRYSVGHHSLDLITLVTLCWQADHADQLPSARLLIACACHDLPERVSGDVPSVVKKFCPELEVVDQLVLVALGVAVSLTLEEERYLEWGDKLELYMWCLEERARGNGAFDSWARHYAELFRVSDKAPSSMRDLAISEVLWNGRRLTDAALHTMIGFQP